tara:strand:- start:10992 stop:12413 length:1422 start_codon:yes stop_codon:yes gene_type:complete
MKRNRKSKILSTLGPATSNKKIIKDLFVSGADIFRLNFSHGSTEEHRKNYNLIREVEKEIGRPICIIADLQGPKLRIGEFKNNEVEIKKGNEFQLDLNKNLGDENRVYFPHPEVYQSLTPNSIILINDGKIRLQVIEQTKDFLKTEILNDSIISNNKGVNIPDVELPLASITSKDKADLQKALDMGVDWIALSFVQTHYDVEELKKIVQEKSLIMAKIEKPSALKNLDNILKVSDGIMIARGDLGVEISPEKIPSIQKNIVRKARQAGKPVVVATQMLESMINNPTPTRAESSDVATAIYDGADTVMLSAETAIGKYPLESVSIMNRIIESVENDDANYLNEIQMQNRHDKSSTDAIIAAADTISRNAQAAVIVTFSVSGGTTFRMARERCPVRVVAISPSIRTARKLCIVWGIHSCVGDDAQNTKEMVSNACKIIKEEGLAKVGDSIVITAGVPFGNAGSTNLLRIAKIIAD